MKAVIITVIFSYNIYQGDDITYYKIPTHAYLISFPYHHFYSTILYQAVLKEVGHIVVNVSSGFIATKEGSHKNLFFIHLQKSNHSNIFKIEDTVYEMFLLRTLKK